MRPLDIALKEYGNEAWPYRATNPEVEKYFDDTGYTFIDEDETPWCSAFMNWVLKQSNFSTPNSLMARSFLKVGVPKEKPELGDLVIFWRISKDGPYGHVGFYIRETEKMIYVLGGNQDSRVCIKPFEKTKVLGYRQLEYTSAPVL